MFYGMCTPLTVNYTTPGYGCEHQGERVTSHYKVEDGTAGIVVYCTHANLRRGNYNEIHPNCHSILKFVFHCSSLRSEYE